MEFSHCTLWNIRSIVWNLAFYNMELVWNSEFHINENGLEIKQCTRIHDYSSTMYLKWVFWAGCSFHCNTCNASAMERIENLRLIHGSYLPTLYLP